MCAFEQRVNFPSIMKLENNTLLRLYKLVLYKVANVNYIKFLLDGFCVIKIMIIWNFNHNNIIKKLKCVINLNLFYFIAYLYHGFYFLIQPIQSSYCYYKHKIQTDKYKFGIIICLKKYEVSKRHFFLVTTLYLQFFFIMTFSIQVHPSYNPILQLSSQILKRTRHVFYTI